MSRVADRDIAAIRAHAVELRKFLLPRWNDWFRTVKGIHNPPLPSKGMCRYSTFFLKRAFAAECSEHWVIRGGGGHYHDVKDDHVGGIITPNGDVEGHYWLQNPETGVIVDITADQFGYEPVIATTREDVYRHTYLDSSIEEHLVHVKSRVDTWLAERLIEVAFSPCVKKLSIPVAKGQLEPTL